MNDLGKWLIGAGVVLVAIGLVVRYAPWAVSWFGRLPGDIRIESGSGRVFIPITSMIILSVALSVIINLLKR
ncbi:MAG: DUF2905 domain-containing protein [Woeseiaceae bacterium]|nr:DUF2905 domain-containing protein [Woeseiaceae bacterium]